MPIILDWQHILLRLLLTVAAGLVIGFNRGGTWPARGNADDASGLPRCYFVDDPGQPFDEQRRQDA